MIPNNDNLMGKSIDQPAKIDEELTNHPDDELLTALLDGELSTDEQVAVEKRLTEDADFALRYQRLRFANRLIDSLAPAPVNEHLSTATMELVSEAVRKELAEMEKKRIKRNLLFGILLFFAVTAAFTLGVWGTLQWRSNHREEIPRPSGRNLPPMPPNGMEGMPLGPMPPGDKEDFRRKPQNAGKKRSRSRNIKQVLPKELRNEQLESLHHEFGQFIQNKFGDKIPEGPKEEVLYQFISELGIDTFIDRLSDSGKEYMAQQPNDQKIRLIGLLILTELFDHRNQFDPNGPRPQDSELPPPEDRPLEDRPPMPDRLNQPDSPGQPDRPTPPNPPNGSPADGFYWKNESTGELAKTLEKLPAETREKLLQLPDEEMYAQLLVLHWGFDPQQPDPEKEGIPPFARPFPGSPSPDRRRNRPLEKDQPFESWNRYLDETQKEKTDIPETNRTELKEP